MHEKWTDRVELTKKINHYKSRAFSRTKKSLSKKKVYLPDYENLLQQQIHWN